MSDIRTGLNALTIHAYKGWTMTRRGDPLKQLKLTTIEQYTTFFPGGLFGMALLFIPGDPAGYLTLRPRDRIEIRNGSDVVWEGEVLNIGYRLARRENGFHVECVGAWGQVLNKTLIDKRWADDRIDEGTWYFTEDGAAAAVLPDKWSLDRENRLHFVPKKEAFTQYDRHTLHYRMPTGETIKRITYSWAMDEGAQAWRLTLKYAGSHYAGTGYQNETATGSGSRDLTPAAAEYNYIEIVADAAQTPLQSGSGGTQVFLKLTDLIVYSETGSINLTEIAKDVIGLVSELSSIEDFIEANTFSLIPFYTEGPEKAGNILLRAASYGGASQESWAVYIRESDYASASAGKPILVAHAYPSLDDYEYQIDYLEQGGHIEIIQDIDRIANYIVAVYTDEAGIRQVITPDDDANLKDAISIDKYGERQLRVDVRTSNETTAKNQARRILADRKNARFYVNGSIKVTGTILSKNEGPIPVANIRSGKRLRIVNFLEDIASEAGAGLTFLITGTSYTDATETCAIATGIPDALEVFLAQKDLLDDRRLVSLG